MRDYYINKKLNSEESIFQEFSSELEFQTPVTFSKPIHILILKNFDQLFLYFFKGGIYTDKAFVKKR